jgi:hypothetical protein
MAPMNEELLWEFIHKSFLLKSLCGASIEVGKNRAVEHVESNGLVLGHAYCILEAIEILKENGEKFDRLRSLSDDQQRNSLRLLKMRNP